MNVQPASDLIGRTLGGRYEILDLIGEGGMAQVYKARQIQLNRLVAVKVMLPHLTRDGTFSQRFTREAQLIAQLRHPHIIQVYDFDTNPPQQLYYMVIELLDGQSLAEQLADRQRKRQPFSVDESLQIMRDVTGALGYAHQHGMIHRDIKPGNVMFDSGRIVLTDFGLARLFDQSGPVSLTTTGTVLGTPAYMSPEQVLGAPGDARSDLYSMGVMFYELISNQLPFDASTPMAMALQQVSAIPRRLIFFDPAVPPAIESVIMRLLAKDPAQRYASATELLHELEHLDQVAPFDPDSLPSAAPPATVVFPVVNPTSARTAPMTPDVRRPSRLIAGLLIVLIVIGIVGVGLLVSRTNGMASVTNPSPVTSPTVALAAASGCNVSLLPDTPSLDLHTGPGLSFPGASLHALNAGDVVTVIGTARDLVSGVSWWDVQHDPDHTGWVPESAVTSPGTCTVPTITFSLSDFQNPPGNGIGNPPGQNPPFGTGNPPFNGLGNSAGTPPPTLPPILPAVTITTTPTTTESATPNPTRRFFRTATHTATAQAIIRPTNPVVPTAVDQATDAIPSQAPTVIPTTDVPTNIPPTDVPTDGGQATDAIQTDVPTVVPPTDVPPTDIPPTDVPPTIVPPTDVPPTDVPPTDQPPAPTDVPPTDSQPSLS